MGTLGSHMPAMLMPAVNSYFAIYTLEGSRPSQATRTCGQLWDLHATATDRQLAISHARMLALQPGVSEVHVKQVTEDLASGQVSVRDIKRCRRGGAYGYYKAASVALAIVCAALMAQFFLG